MCAAARPLYFVIINNEHRTNEKKSFKKCMCNVHLIQKKSYTLAHSDKTDFWNYIFIIKMETHQAKKLKSFFLFFIFKWFSFSKNWNVKFFILSKVFSSGWDRKRERQNILKRKKLKRNKSKKKIILKNQCTTDTGLL